jgi:phosphoketolase
LLSSRLGSVFINSLFNKKGDNVRVYLPPDADRARPHFASILSDSGNCRVLSRSAARSRPVARFSRTYRFHETTFNWHALAC